MREINCGKKLSERNEELALGGAREALLR